MNPLDIPLMTQSTYYASAVETWIRNAVGSQYLRKRLVNFMIHYDIPKRVGAVFHYTRRSGQDQETLEIINPFSCTCMETRVPIRLAFRIIMKVGAHSLFRTIGNLQDYAIREVDFQIVRKSHVEDVESLFDSRDGVLRIVFPFPLNVPRQISYIRMLRKNRQVFRLGGMKYGFREFIEFILNRKFINLFRLESRASIRFGQELCRNYYNAKSFETSDDYEFSAISLCRVLRRSGLVVTNAAHGVGKYLPFHCYNKFYVLTKAQCDYYDYFHDNHPYYRMTISLRKMGCSTAPTFAFPNGCAVVFIGQNSSDIYPFIGRGEKEVLSVFSRLTDFSATVSFFYKKHPNLAMELDYIPEGVNVIASRVRQEDSARVIYVSLFSTCQIDPNYSGLKLLVETTEINPRYVFGSFEPIIHISKLESTLKYEINRLLGLNCEARSLAYTR